MTTTTNETTTQQADATAEASNVVTFTPTATVEFQKWSCSADLGPRMATVFKKALSDCQSQANTITEIRGIHGKPETQTSYGIQRYSIGGGGREKQNPHFMPKLIEVQRKHGSVVTPANYKTLVSEIEAVAQFLRECPMIEDNRETQEEIDTRNEVSRLARVEQARRDAEAAAEKNTHLVYFKARYPWAKQSGSNQARCAANLKTLLSMEFPGIAFSCKSDSASMTDSVRVSWSMGPTQKQVEELTKHAQYGRFDGMADYYESKTGAEGEAWREWMGYTKYFNAERSLDPEAKRTIEQAMVGFGFKADGTNGFDRDSAYSVARSLLNCTPLPAGAVVTGAEHMPENEKNPDAEPHLFAAYYRVLFTAPAIQTLPTPETPANDEGTAGSGGIAKVTLNSAKGGVEIRFAQKPDESVIADCKRSGFRWAKFTRCWYAKASPSTIATAHRIAGTNADQDIHSEAAEAHRQGAIGMEIACGIA